MSWRHARLFWQALQSLPRTRLAVSLTAGLLVFGAATAFATSMTVTADNLGSGNATVLSCTASATVAYNTTYSSAIPGYKITTVSITTATGCAGKAYKVTLTGASNAALGTEKTGTLLSTAGNEGKVTLDFTADNVSAAAVTGISIVVSG